MNLEKAAEAMERVGIPGGDAYDLPTSKKRFPDGAWYRMEVSGVERPNVLEALIDEMGKRNIAIHRLISVVMGATLLDRQELRDFAQMAAEARLEVILTPGPRPAWDVGRQLATPEGCFSGIRCRGCDQLKYTVADIMQGIDIGFRGFLLFDEGLLKVLTDMRNNGDIPRDVVFKISNAAGHSSAAGGKLLQELGAATFNPLGDVTLPQLASIRQVVDIPMDIFVILAESLGGFVRFCEAPEIVRVAAPCYLKIEPGPALVAGAGAIYKPWADRGAQASLIREKVKYACIVHEIVQENFPEATLSQQAPDDSAIPKPQITSA